MTYPDAGRRALAIFAVVLAAACGQGGRDRPSAQPTPNATTFQPGRFDDLPVFPRSEPLGPRNDENGVVSRSFRADGTNPEAILRYYRGALGPEWQLMHEFERLGPDTYRADWTDGEWRLRISATRAPTVNIDNAGAETTVQYSLHLHPIRGG